MVQPMKKYMRGQIVTLPRRMEVGVAHGEPAPKACKEGNCRSKV